MAWQCWIGKYEPNTVLKEITIKLTSDAELGKITTGMSLTEKSTTCFSLAKKDHHRLFNPVHSFLDRCSPIISPKFAQNVFGFYRSTLPIALWFTLSNAGSPTVTWWKALCVPFTVMWLFLAKLSAWLAVLSVNPLKIQWHPNGRPVAPCGTPYGTPVAGWLCPLHSSVTTAVTRQWPNFRSGRRRPCQLYRVKAKPTELKSIVMKWA